MIAQSSIERINAIPIYEVLSHYITLKPNGTNYKALSPWSNEKSESLMVNKAKNFFKDFSSGKGGNAIRFVMEFTSLSFPDAIKDIAAKCGERIEFDNVPQDEASKQAHQEKVDHLEELYKLNFETANKYVEQLQTVLKAEADSPLKQEIAKRQYTPETIAQWQLGMAPDQWQFITDLAGDKQRANAIELGLIKTNETKGKTFDFFRNRLIFPIHNLTGRVVGFGGRLLPGDNNDQAKYFNSSDSPIYKKETILFGLNHAHQAIDENKMVYLVEGYTDVISMHQAGYNCTVGKCGTSLTQDQIKLLKRYCNKVVLFPDLDCKPGQKIGAGYMAALRDLDLLLAQGFDVQIVPMPVIEGKTKIDPDDLVRMFTPVVIDTPLEAEIKKVKAEKKSKPVTKKIVKTTKPKK